MCALILQKEILIGVVNDVTCAVLVIHDVFAAQIQVLLYRKALGGVQKFRHVTEWVGGASVQRDARGRLHERDVTQWVGGVDSERDASVLPRLRQSAGGRPPHFKNLGGATF